MIPLPADVEDALIQSAKTEDATARSALGAYYWKSSIRKLREKNYLDAFPLARAAAFLGVTDAFSFVGVAYLHGMGIPEDQAEGVRWLRAGAARGDSIAMLNLANAYEKGTGVPKDPEEGRRWRQKAAGSGPPVLPVPSL